MEYNANAYKKASRRKKKEIHQFSVHLKAFISNNQDWLFNGTQENVFYTSVLKKQIPVEPHFEKPRGNAGYVELATVHHSGGDPRGDYCLTLAESHNFTLVRAYVGYSPYDTDAEYEILKELIPLICKLHNYFMPKISSLSYFELLARIITLQKKLERVHKKR